MDFTKQALFDAGTRAALGQSGLPVRLHFGWHMTCEEIRRMARLKLKARSPCPLVGHQDVMCSWVVRTVALTMYRGSMASGLRSAGCLSVAFWKRLRCPSTPLCQHMHACSGQLQRLLSRQWSSSSSASLWGAEVAVRKSE